MAKTPEKAAKGRGGGEETPPQSYPQTTPEFSQPSHDFTLQAVMQLQKGFGEISEKLGSLNEGIKKQSDKLDQIEKIVDRVKTGVIVSGAILSVVGIVFWWAIGDRITNAVRAALSTPVVAVQPALK